MGRCPEIERLVAGEDVLLDGVRRGFPLNVLEVQFDVVALFDLGVALEDGIVDDVAVRFLDIEVVEGALGADVELVAAEVLGLELIDIAEGRGGFFRLIS